MRNLIMTAVAGLGLALAQAPAAQAADYTLRFGGAGPEADVVFSGSMRVFAEEVEKLTEGKVKVELFYGGALGSNREMLELLKVGTVTFAYLGSSHASRFAPTLNAVLLPYLWKDSPTMFGLLDGEVGGILAADLDAAGYRVMGWWDTGFRHVSNNLRPIVKPEDISGLKLRTLPTKVHVDFFTKLGSLPTPMDWVEVMPALQQGVIDGQENPAAVMKNFGVYEAQKYYSLTGHVIEPVLFIGSKAKLDSLPADLQEKLQAAADIASEYQRKSTTEQNELMMTELKGLIQVNEVPEETIAVFRKTAQGMYADVVAEIGGSADAMVKAIVKDTQ